MLPQLANLRLPTNDDDLPLARTLVNPPCTIERRPRLRRQSHTSTWFHLCYSFFLLLQKTTSAESKDATVNGKHSKMRCTSADYGAGVSLESPQFSCVSQFFFVEHISKMFIEEHECHHHHHHHWQMSSSNSRVHCIASLRCHIKKCFSLLLLGVSATMVVDE